jgi:hypothetical protein
MPEKQTPPNLLESRQLLALKASHSSAEIHGHETIIRASAGK